MTRSLIGLWALISLAGCSKDVGAAPLPNAGEPVAPAAKTAESALVDRCIAAHEHSRTVDPAAAYGVIVDQCLTLMVKQEGCRQALKQSLVVDAAVRASTVATGCAAAYCPLLPEPKPAICARDVASIAPTELPRLFSELFMQVRTRELGATEAARLERGIKEIVARDKAPKPP